MEEVVKGNGKKVCVTGASGFVASWLVKLLLQRGYTVNATVRDPSDSKKTKHLMALEGAKERMQLFKADLMEENSFDCAIAGCDGVFHTASPVIFKSTNPQEDVVDPAVKGTHNVLASCKKYPTVRRVIFTSSNCTTLFIGRPLTSDDLIDETWFSDPKYCEGSDVMWYVLSKVLAEQAALNFAKENGIDLIVMIPGMSIGPMLQPTLNESVSAILNLINGSEYYPDLACPWLHVKDVAEAHIRAFEIPTANGRYLLSESVLHYSDILKILHELYPTFKLPHKCVDFGLAKWMGQYYQISNSRSKSLGIEYIPIEISIKETVESLKEKNFV